MMHSDQQAQRPHPTRKHAAPERYSQKRQALRKSAAADLATVQEAGHHALARETRQHLRWLKTAPAAEVRDLWQRMRAVEEAQEEEEDWSKI